MALHQIARMVDAAHEEMRMERDRRALELFDEAWATRPVMVDNGPAMIAMVIPFALGLVLGAVSHMAWLAVRG